MSKPSEQIFQWKSKCFKIFGLGDVLLRSKFILTVPEVIQLLLVEHNRRAIVQQINAKCNSYSESSTQTLSVRQG